MATDAMMNEFYTPDLTDDVEVDAAQTEIDGAIEAPATKVEKTATTKKFIREIDLEDGSGKQVFQADTVDELLDKLTDAQKHATKKIRDQEKRLKVVPERTEEPGGVSKTIAAELSAEELRQFKEMYDLDPVGATLKMIERHPEVQKAKNFNVERETLAAQNHAEAQFLAAVPEFKPSETNAKLMINFLKSESLAYTAKNLEYAFQELTESGLLEVKSDAVEENAQGEESESRIVVPKHTRSKPMSTGARSGQVASKRVEENSDAVVESSVQKILANPDVESARQQMQALMAKQRKAASIN